jgi:hypothetical protein
VLIGAAQPVGRLGQRQVGAARPVLVPMLMLLGISPEMATAAYRVGDSATNIITPLMVYFPLILIFCQRWQKDFGLGSLAATMLPYSIGLLVVGVAMTIGWVALDLPLGPGASVFLEFPQLLRRPAAVEWRPDGLALLAIAQIAPHARIVAAALDAARPRRSSRRRKRSLGANFRPSRWRPRAGRRRC